MKMKMSWLMVVFLLMPGTASANKWVHGKVSAVEDYTAYSGNHQVKITLINKSWPDGVESGCTGKFRLVASQQNVTEEIKSRIYTALLTAQLTGKTARLSVNKPSNSSECIVQVGGIVDS